MIHLAFLAFAADSVCRQLTPAQTQAVTAQVAPAAGVSLKPVRDERTCALMAQMSGKSAISPIYLLDAGTYYVVIPAGPAGPTAEVLKVDRAGRKLSVK